jgi:uncharacterized protein YjbI with pentapeptide repeats
VANPEHLEIVRQGNQAVKRYGEANPDVPFMLEGADLKGLILRDVNLNSANFRGADLKGAKLIHVMLREADLTGADCSGADINRTDL